MFGRKKEEEKPEDFTEYSTHFAVTTWYDFDLAFAERMQAKGWKLVNYGCNDGYIWSKQ